MKRLLALLLPAYFVSPLLTPVHRFRTAGAAGCAFDAPYLACANFWDGIAPNMEAKSVLYRVAANGSAFALHPEQRFLGRGAHGADLFSAGGAHFLVIPSYYGCDSDRGPAKPDCGSTVVYRREGAARFVEHQRLATAGPSQTVHFALPGNDATTWLLTGENFNDEVCAWELRGGRFEKRGGGCLRVPGAGALALAVEGRDGWAGPTLLVTGSYFDDGWATRSRVFRFAAGGGGFEEVQRIDTFGAHGVALRCFGGELLLFFSEDRGPNGPLVNSTLLRWDAAAAQFVVVQRLPTDGAHGARFLEVGGVPHLFVANFGDRLGTPPRYAARSALWRAAGPRGEGPWAIDAEVLSHGATDVTVMEGVGGSVFVVLSNEGDLGKRTHQRSVVYRVDDPVTPEREL